MCIRDRPQVIDQIKLQLAKLVPVHKVAEFKREDKNVIFKEMALFKITGKKKKMEKCLNACKKFDLVILDETKTSKVIQITALRREVDRMANDLKKYGFVGDARAIGLIGAIEFVTEPDTSKKPDPARKVAAKIQKKIQEEGVILRGLHCPSPLCVPSRFSYLTGQYASRATNTWMQHLHRIHKKTFVAQETEITSDTPTFAKHLKALGYVTGFYGKNHSIEQREWTKLPADADVSSEHSKKYLKNQHQLIVDAIKNVGFDYVDRIYHTNPRAHGPLAISQHNICLLYTSDAADE